MKDLVTELSNFIEFIGSLFVYPVIFLTDYLHFQHGISVLITAFLFSYSTFVLVFYFWKLDLFSPLKITLNFMGGFFLLTFLASIAFKTNYNVSQYEDTLINVKIYGMIFFTIIVIAVFRLIFEHAYFEGLFGRFKDS